MMARQPGSAPAHARDRRAPAEPGPDDRHGRRRGDHAAAPVRLCLLGGFRLLEGDRPVPVRTEQGQLLLAQLGLRLRAGIPRDELMSSIWPTTTVELADQSLNTLVYAVHRLLGDAMAGHHPVLRDSGVYRLNVEAGIAVDVAEFDAAVERGDQEARAGDHAAAIRSYGGAAALYVGDLFLGSEVQQVIERERLRARYLHSRSRLADHEFGRGQYAEALADSLEVLRTIRAARTASDGDAELRPDG